MVNSQEMLLDVKKSKIYLVLKKLDYTNINIIIGYEKLDIIHY